MTKNQLLSQFWRKVFKTDFRFVVITFILLGIVRVIGLADVGTNLVVLGFLVMWVLPFVFLSKGGRRKIGIKKPENWAWVLLSLVMGVLAAGGVCFLGYALYGTGQANWGMTIVHEYLEQGDVIIPGVFVVVTLFSMLFSPIGEELFFRGIIHETLAHRLSSYKRAGVWSSLAFAAIHIPHHDITFGGKGFFGLFVPLILWSILMFLVSFLFIYARRRSGSILGAIFCHSGYILGMNLFIYFVLLPKV